MSRRAERPVMKRALLIVLPALLLLLVSCIGMLQAEQGGPVGKFITVDGVRLHYVMAGDGSGPAIVLVHGASSNLREFTSSILPELAKSHRVIAFDRPGYGFSERPPEREWLDPSQVASLLLDAAEALGASKPVLVGHSWAGSVVMSAMVDMPERIVGGVLISGVAGHWAGPLNWTYSLGKVPVLNQLFAWTLVQPLGRLMLEDALAEVFAPDSVPAGQVERTDLALALRPGSYLINGRDMNQLSAYMQALSPHYDEIRLPLLIIHGESDTLVPFWNHGRRLLPVIPQAQVLLLPRTGHAPHHTRTAQVSDAIHRFALGEVRPPLAQPWPIWPLLPARAEKVVIPDTGSTHPQPPR